jgi:hypothetical protein
MRFHISHLTCVTLLVGVLSFAPLASAQTTKTMAEHEHTRQQHTTLCTGFVVLPNGYAVLSAVQPGPPSGMHHGRHHGTSPEQGGTHQSTLADPQRLDHTHQRPHRGSLKPPDHLLGHKHGDAISTSKDVLCVPLGEKANTSWTAVSTSPGLHVTATSLKGTLAHNSRANESLSFTLRRDGKLIEAAHVSVTVRMPHHDHRMPGGHGPANDPDVTGFDAVREAPGRYTVPTIDFSMPGPWLIAIRVQQDGQTHSAYLAVHVGEE